jgi:hypothetical protein
VNLPTAHLLALTTLLPRLALAEPAAPPPLTDAELGPVYNVANALAARPPCSAAGDLLAAEDFARAAALLDVAARHYPPAGPRVPPAVHAGKRLHLVAQAVDLHVAAYQCAPGHPQRHHLDRAIALLDAARVLVVDTDHLPKDAPELADLAQRRTQLLAALPPKPTVGEPPPPPPPPPPTPPSAPPPYYGHLALRPELGLGSGYLHDEDDSGQDAFTGVYLRLVAGARVPLGRRARHGLLLGGALGLQTLAKAAHFDGPTISSSIPHGGLLLEFALHAHPRWVSLHPALELGVATYVGGVKFGRLYAAPGLGLCLDRELACFTFRYNASLALPDLAGRIQFMQVGLAIDIMRIVDRRRAAR